MAKQDKIDAIPNTRDSLSVGANRSNKQFKAFPGSSREMTDIASGAASTLRTPGPQVSLTKLRVRR